MDHESGYGCQSGVSFAIGFVEGIKNILPRKIDATTIGASDAVYAFQLLDTCLSLEATPYLPHILSFFAMKKLGILNFITGNSPYSSVCHSCHWGGIAVAVIELARLRFRQGAVVHRTFYGQLRIP
ncbi:rhomboid protein 1, mitochondrial [Corchorus olitorius]|uniref:Rhomboid protein 1, mitochondrial n=1 Tax=Corchorus olitorius TaxID=93759 RepID=A0A1R3KAK3_9ROSI|nr:rhomboid protein 1, mitochondrial [Corchorus olitorius]